MNAIQRPPERFLTDDEVIEMPDRDGVVFPFRLRVWRGEAATAVALVSQYATKEVTWLGPASLSTKLANFVNVAVLGHPANGMIYFEDECDPRDGKWNLTQCYFSYYGNAHRLKMYQPSRRIVEWGLLEHIMGGPVERMMK